MNKYKIIKLIDNKYLIIINYKNINKKIKKIL